MANYGLRTVTAEFLIAEKDDSGQRHIRKFNIIKDELGDMLFTKENQHVLRIPQELWLELKRVF